MTEDSTTTQPAKKRSHPLVWLLWSVLILALALGLYFYWQYQKHYPSTDDAYVQANVIHVAAQVSGPVERVYVQNHQLVKKGELLVEIDPTPFQYALTKAHAEYINAEQQIQGQIDAVKNAEAGVAERQAQLINAQKNFERINALFQKKLASFAENDQAQSAFHVAKAALARAESQLAQVKAELGAQGQANVQLQIAKANYDQAQLNLEHTRITAPTAGFIAQFKLRTGSMVTAQQPLFALIDNSHWWVEANYKETEIDRIKVGQKATIEVDMYPGHTFNGVVISLGRGSGSAFSLLPPENATGNWVKVTQRFPIRVKIINPNSKYPLRVGASSTVTIDTTHSDFNL